MRGLVGSVGLVGFVGLVGLLGVSHPGELKALINPGWEGVWGEGALPPTRSYNPSYNIFVYELF